MPSDETPLEAAEFAALMAAAGPFEEAPHVAVALSGGPDSLALTFILAAWCAETGGCLTALTVDHALRPASAAEARQVAAWMAGRRIPHVILPWEGEKPATGLMAAAREARYALLDHWCRENGVLHLALGHQREDQAATFLMRLKRGSGLDGLSAMPHATEGFPRHLRPLLDIPRARLKATLRALSHDWIEDPSNSNPAFERSAATEFVANANPLALTAARIALAVKSLARARTAIEEGVAAALAASVTLSPLGPALLDPAPFARHPEEVRLRALAHLLMTVGGEAYTPRLERLERLLCAIETGALRHGRTLAGCRIRPEDGKIRLLREAAAIAPQTVIDKTDFRWDRRFRLSLSPALAAGTTFIGPLTPERWREIREDAPTTLPALLRPTLPVLWDENGIVAAPFTGYCREGVTMPQAVFAPPRPLT